MNFNIALYSVFLDSFTLFLHNYGLFDRSGNSFLVSKKLVKGPHCAQKHSSQSSTAANF